MSECSCLKEHGCHDFDWDKSQICSKCEVREGDVTYELEKQITQLKAELKAEREAVDNFINVEDSNNPKASSIERNPSFYNYTHLTSLARETQKKRMVVI